MQNIQPIEQYRSHIDSLVGSMFERIRDSGGQLFIISDLSIEEPIDELSNSAFIIKIYLIEDNEFSYIATKNKRTFSSYINALASIKDKNNGKFNVVPGLIFQYKFVA